MTEHPAAPTPRDQLFDEVDERFGRNVARFVDARLDAALADARAAERKEVAAIIEALPIMAAQHSCWDDHEGGPNGPHADGTPCRDRVLWEAVDRRAILDSLSTDTREEPIDE